MGFSMSTQSSNVLGELERQTELDRENLVRSVDAIQERVSPTKLKASARSFARHTGQRLIDQVEAQFRHNPLQTVAISAGLAYPLLRFLSRMPAPALVIGAGVVLSNRQIMENLRGAFDGEPNEGPLGRVKSGISSTVEDLKRGASQSVDQVSGNIDSTVDAVREAASSAASGAAAMVNDTYQNAKQAAASAVSHADQSYDKVRHSVVGLVDRHPIIAGDVAFAGGSLVASALPVTRRENRLMGEASDAIKDMSQRAVSEGLDHTQTAAEEVYDAASREVHDHGLSPATARKTVRTARNAVHKSVGTSGSHSEDSSNRSNAQPVTTTRENEK